MDDAKVWLKQNSIRNNTDNIVKILEESHFKHYNITQNSWGEYDIFLRHMAKSYKIELDESTLSYVLLEENLSLNSSHKPKYHKVKSFYSNSISILYDVLYYIENVKNRNCLENNSKYRLTN